MKRIFAGPLWRWSRFQKVKLSWIAVAPVLALGTLGLSPMLLTAQEANKVTSTSRTGTEAADTFAYWTPERKAAAVPMDVGRPNTGVHTLAAPTALGTPSVAGGYSASTGRVTAPEAVHPDSGSENPNATVLLDGGFPGPNATYYYAPSYSQFPISAVGKLYGHDPRTGGDFQCSASVTVGDASHLNVIWTAGHCVANGGNSYFYSNFLFCPQLRGGSEPVGCWSWDGGAVVFSVWFANGDLTRDEGVILLNHTGTKYAKDVASVTGGLGLAWNWSRDQHWFHYGYPCVGVSGVTPNWNCVDIVATAAEHRYDVNPGGSGPEVNSWGSAQTEGASGSAVQLDHNFNYGGGYFINSNVSFYFNSGPNGNEHGKELQGPYYDTTVCSSLWKPYTGYTGGC